MSISASGDSVLPVLSKNRRHIAFLSSARNLDTNDNFAAYLDVFRHDLVTEQTLLVSHRASWFGGANAASSAPSISSNGQWIAFVSTASDLLPSADENSGSDIFLSHIDSYARSLVSATPNGAPPGNPVLTRNLRLSDKPQLSANSRWVAFESFATNLTVNSDANNDSDVFLRDTVSNETILISVAHTGGTTANGKSTVVSITPDGEYVLFSSTATNLVSNNSVDGYQELYVRDIAAGLTAIVEHGELPKPYACRWASISANGRFVLYKVEFPPSTIARVFLYDRASDSNILVTANARADYPVSMSPDAQFIAYDETNHVFVLDRQTGARTQASGDEPAHSPVLSDDGTLVAFVSGPANTPFQICWRNMVTGQLRRVTETIAGGPSGKDHNSAGITVDPAGEFIVFDSAEDELVLNDRNRASDVFLHYIATGETRLISRAHEHRLAFTPTPGAAITNASINAEGTRILFFSHDSNLVPGDTNGWQDAFLRDLGTGRTLALSTNESGMFSPTNFARHGVLSADGRYALLGLVSMRSRSELAFPYATIVRKALDTDETLGIISNVGPASFSFPISIPFFAFSISADGRWITYPFNSLIMVADMLTGVQTNLTPSDPNWTDPLVSGDGSYVLYVKRNPRVLAITDLSNGDRITLTNLYTTGAAFTHDAASIVYGTTVGPSPAINLYSTAAATNTLVCTDCWNPQASADGRYVVYQTDTPFQVEIKDMQSGKRTPITRNVTSTGAANISATWPAISRDGRYVAYTSKATNLTTDVPNGWNNLYVYDRLQGTTIRITGASGNSGYGSGSASRPVLGPNGRTLVFQSFASDFVANDFNDTRDIFLLTLGGDDTDNDGMPDDWEQTHFSTTDRDSTGDLDHDGSTDLAEYLAGTNPNDNQSFLEVLQITSVGTGQRQLIWNAQPGKSYRLEYKSDLPNATWTSLGHVITATQPTASAIDTTATAEKRFYRVALVQ